MASRCTYTGKREIELNDCSFLTRSYQQLTTALLSAVERLRAKEAELRATLNELNAAVESAQRELDDCNNSIVAVDLDGKRKELADLLKQLENAHKRQSDLQRQLKECQDKHNG